MPSGPRSLVVVALVAPLGCRGDDGAGLDDGAGAEDIAGRCTMSATGSPGDDDGLWAHMSELPPSEDDGGNPLPGNLVATQIACTGDPAKAGHLWMTPERTCAVPGLPAWLGIWVVDTVAVVERDEWSFLAGHHPAPTTGSRKDAYQNNPQFRRQSYSQAEIAALSQDLGSLLK